MGAYDTFLLVITLVVFGLTLISFSFERLSKFYVPIAILGTGLVCILYIPKFDNADVQITSMIQFRALIFIFSMQIIVTIIEQQRIFQYIAIHMIRTTRGNSRVLFYVFCLTTTFFAAIIADVTVSLIFAPLILRVCKILEINPSPYLFGMTISINLGSLITPFSSSENIIISSYAGQLVYQQPRSLNIYFFITNTWLLFGVALFLTMLLIDLFLLRGHERPNEAQKVALLNILKPSMVIEKGHEKKFYMNLILVVAIFLFIIFWPQSFTASLIGAMVLILANRKHFLSVLRDIEWEILFFFTSLFILIGLVSNFTIFLDLIITGFYYASSGNGILMVLMVFVISSVLSAFISNAPITLLFLPIIGEISSSPEFSHLTVPLIVALLLGINLGGNFLPQGAACDMMTLTIAKRHNVKNFTYKRLFKVGGSFAGLHFALSFVYLIILIYVTS
ncbi:MAG: SLC13 family permease [Promethearchaeota archaeon]